MNQGTFTFTPPCFERTRSLQTLLCVFVPLCLCVMLFLNCSLCFSVTLLLCVTLFSYFLRLP
jgi:hypothetical protein